MPVDEGGEDRHPEPRLEVLVRSPSRRPRVEEVRQLRFERGEQRLERPDLEPDPKRRGDLAGRLRRARVGESRRNVNRHDPLRPERLDGDRRHERGVDPSREAENDGRNAVPLDESADAEGEGREELRLRVRLRSRRPEDGGPFAPSRSTVATSSAKRGSLASSSPPAESAKLPPSKISSSCAPTALTNAIASRCLRAARSRSGGIPTRNGDATSAKSASAPCEARSAAGCAGYPSSHTSSQTSAPTRRPASSNGSLSRPGTNQRGSWKTSYAGRSLFGWTWAISPSERSSAALASDG